ncbi:MAG: hypothetical protein ABSG94_04680 [Brevinematales bacterium]|jgi:hypothetical protein
MSSLIKEKSDLMEIIKDFPESKIIELLDFAQFLKLKKNVAEDPIALESYKDKILHEDKNLLSRLSK